MTGQVWTLDYYINEGGRAPFRDWFESLRDFKAQEVIDTRMARVRLGNFGNCQPVGQSVLELKIKYGPGYRVYFGRTGEKIILLLCGGDKSTQQKDIQTAHRFWRRFEERHA